jgi:hypothetical protein
VAGRQVRDDDLLDARLLPLEVVALEDREPLRVDRVGVGDEVLRVGNRVDAVPGRVSVARDVELVQPPRPRVVPRDRPLEDGVEAPTVGGQRHGLEAPRAREVRVSWIRRVG